MKLSLAANIEKSIEMSLTVPNSEKELAKQISELLDAVLGTLRNVTTHLDIMLIPFQKADEISTEEIKNKAAIINRYKQKIIENYETVKKRALQVLNKLNYFSSDGHAKELINSFINNIDDIEKEVNNLIETLSDDEALDFKDQVISNIESINKQIAELKNFIEDRMIEYIDTDILNKNWMNNSKDDILKNEIIEKIPLITKLVKEREDALGKHFPTALKDEQSTNPSDAQQIWNPDFVRTKQIGDE